MHEAIDLTHEQCERLLRAGTTGRVALSTPDGPHIVPVNYSVVGDAIVLRTTPYSLLGTYGRGSTLAFEVDGVDHDRWRGWSVVARGRGAPVTDPVELDRIREVWDPRPWASGTRTLYLRIPWTELTGRQIGTGWDPLGSVPVRRAV